MLLLPIFQPKKLNYVVLFVALASVGMVKTETNETSKVEADDKTPVVVLEQKSVKKELKVNIADEAIVEITTPNEKGDHHTKKLTTTIDENSVIGLGKAQEQQSMQKGSGRNSVSETGSKPGSLQSEYHVDADFILNDEDSVSESLKAGFYFFLILSSGAIVFIIFKIYRLRLSRAERKYGVQGDRSTQELTPLPTSIEDGHSDDEDQTLFDIQRQNIRIL